MNISKKFGTRVVIVWTAIVVMFWLYLLTGCAKANPPAVGSICTNSAGVVGVIGNDGLCYTCNTGYYANYGYAVNCGYPNSADVSCCGNYSTNYVVCSKPGYPWLCSDGNCWSQSNGNGSLACVYDP